MDVAAPTLDPGPARDPVAGGPLEARWLGRIGYRDAWALQHELVERRIAGEIPDQLLLLEHPAVLTLGRNAEEGHVRASPAELAARGIEVIRVERGGEVTYHGPGQLVAYPILALSRRGLLLRPHGPRARGRDGRHVSGVRRRGRPARRPSRLLVRGEGPAPRKIGALGIRVERGVSYHGIALNIDPDLADFDLIDPCGMPEVVSTSIARELGGRPTPPATERGTGGRHLRAGRSPTGWAPGCVASRRRRRRAPDAWRPASSSCARTRSPAGGSRRSSTAPSIATGSRCAAEPVNDGGHCQNCAEPPGDGVRVRTLKDFAFHVVGTDADARELDASLVQVALSQASPPGAGGRPSRRRASTGRSTPSAPTRSPGCSTACRTAIRDAKKAGQTEYLQVVQNWGAQAGARTNHLCLDLYDLPQIPHRIAEELGGAARFVIREGGCPWCRLVVDETARPERLIYQDDANVAFAPYASRSPFEVWVVPRRHDADFARADRRGGQGDRRIAPPRAHRPRHARRPALQHGAPHGPAQGAGRRDVPLALGDPSAAARDRRPRDRDRPPGEPGRPEDAVDELLRQARGADCTSDRAERGPDPGRRDQRMIGAANCSGGRHTLASRSVSTPGSCSPCQVRERMLTTEARWTRSLRSATGSELGGSATHSSAKGARGGR